VREPFSLCPRPALERMHTQHASTLNTHTRTHTYARTHTTHTQRARSTRTLNTHTPHAHARTHTYHAHTHKHTQHVRTHTYTHSTRTHTRTHPYTRTLHSKLNTQTQHAHSTSTHTHSHTFEQVPSAGIGHKRIHLLDLVPGTSLHGVRVNVTSRFNSSNATVQPALRSVELFDWGVTPCP
jgi:hypothetical protein